jgi:phage baseplate assembly protein V
MNFSDLQRRLENLVRIGTIAQVDLTDAAAPRVRVQDGELLTNWLPFGTLRAGTARVWSAPTVGEQVIMLSPSGELASAVVFGSLFCAGIQAPSTDPHEHVIDFADGTRVSHNDATGAMVFTGMRTVLMRASESVTIETADMLVKASGSVTHDAPATTATGTLTSQGPFDYQAGMTGTGGAGGSTTITGPITQTGGDLSSNGVVLHTHQHPGVVPGGSKTGAPE